MKCVTHQVRKEWESQGPKETGSRGADWATEFQKLWANSTELHHQSQVQSVLMRRMNLETYTV